jgi:hypothetical protein
MVNMSNLHKASKIFANGLVWESDVLFDLNCCAFSRTNLQSGWRASDFAEAYVKSSLNDSTCRAAELILRGPGGERKRETPRGNLSVFR